MIEFKADCGHTVRAKDENAGGVVRCSYCGREASVPEDNDDELDFLFNELDHQDISGATASKKKKRRGRGLFASRRPKKSFDPFAVILKLGWAAILIAVVFFVGGKFVLPLFREGGLNERTAHRQAQPTEAPKRRQRGNRKPESVKPGLIDRDQLKGLYVASTPPGASAYYIPFADAPEKGRIIHHKKCKSITVGGAERIGGNGQYVVEVALPWNHPNLTVFAGYREFRRQIEDGSDAERRKLINDYFLPDEATDVFIDRYEGELFIVRQYRDVTVREGKSQGVRALFLPSIKKGNSDAISIEALVLNYLPEGKKYFFDEKHVLNELDYYNVALDDQPFVLEALARIGVIPYLTPQGLARILKIGIHDGRMTASLIKVRSR